MMPMQPRPVSLSGALASFDDIYSPRIVGRVNDYDVRVAHVKGEHVWHVHDRTEIFVVPKGTEHKPSSSGGAIMMFEPSGTSTTGDRHGDIPGYVDSTTGHELS